MRGCKAILKQTFSAKVLSLILNNNMAKDCSL